MTTTGKDIKAKERWGLRGILCRCHAKCTKKSKVSLSVGEILFLVWNNQHAGVQPQPNVQIFVYGWLSARYCISVFTVTWHSSLLEPPHPHAAQSHPTLLIPLRTLQCVRSHFWYKPHPRLPLSRCRPGGHAVTQISCSCCCCVLY